MGFSLSWTAVRTERRAQALAAAGYAGTGQFEMVPESRATGVETPAGWFVIVENDVSTPLTGQALLRQLSQDGDVVTCTVEEHAMVSVAESWQGGRQAWQVVHDANAGLRDLQLAGTPPPDFEAIRDALWRKQDAKGRDVDYSFDIPVELAKAIVGFRHDMCFDEDAFEVLARTA